MRTESPKIKQCVVGPYPKQLFDSMPAVTVEFADGTKKELFRFYPDEISFQAHEFIGLTEVEARELRRQRDLAYLRS